VKVAAPAAAAPLAGALRERPDVPVPPSEVAPAEQALARQAFQLAITLRSGPQPDTALPQLDAALAHDPRFARAYVSRGGLALLGNRLQDAVFDFQRALQVEPSSALPLYGVGRAYEKAGDRAKACEYYRRFGASNAPDASTKLQEQALAACR
jgi:tetratricopeptide (TPR) repeat protein